MSDEIIIYDTEYWTDNGALDRCWHGLDDQPPVLIQIGAYKVKRKAGLPVLKEWLSYVTPIGRKGEQININNYFCELTGITQEKIDQDGKHPTTAILEFSEFVGARKMYSYGDDIFDTFLPTCYINNIKCPFDVQQGIDIRAIFRKSGVTDQEINSHRSGSIAQHFGVALEKHHEHDAKDDAYSLLEATRYLVENKKLRLDWL